MKFLKITFLIITITLFTACSSNNENTKRNQVTAGSQNFEIAQSIMFNDGTFDGITEYELYLTGSGLSINNGKNFSGTGEFIYLRLFSGDASVLQAGNYILNSQDNTTFLFNRGLYHLEYDAAKGDNQSRPLDIKSGSVSIEVENGIYTITINLTEENSNVVTGYYSGTINIVD